MNQNIIYRKADLKDSNFLADLSGELGYSSTKDELEKRLAAIIKSVEHKVFVAENDFSEVIGWIHVFGAVRLESSRFAELGGLVVSSKYRGQKIGEQLLHLAEMWAKERGYKKIRVRSQVKRTDAHRFYEKLGYPYLKEQKVFEKVFEK